MFTAPMAARAPSAHSIADRSGHKLIERVRALLLGPLVLQFADHHHAFHEDAKPGDLSLQLGARRFNSSKKLVTRMSSAAAVSVSPIRNITNR